MVTATLARADALRSARLRLVAAEHALKSAQCALASLSVTDPRYKFDSRRMAVNVARVNVEYETELIAKLSA